MSQDISVVLDLGTTKAVCLAATLDRDQVKVLAMASTHSKALKKGVLSDPEEAAKALDVVVRRVEQDLGHEVGSLVVSIGGGHIEGLTAQGLKMIVPRARLITHQDILEVIKHSRSIMLPPDREQVQAVPREFRVDGERDVQKPVGMSGSKLEVSTFIITGAASAIQKVEKAVTMTGHKIEQLVLTSLAAGLGVASPEGLEGGVAVVDVGGSLTEMAIFSAGSIVGTASFPVGGEHVTSDISLLLKTSLDEAERLKIDKGSALADKIHEGETVDVMQENQDHVRPMQRRVLCEIMESRMREIASIVHDQITRSGYDTLLPGGVILTGGGAHLANTDKLFQEVFKQHKVRLVEPKLGGGIAAEPGMAVAAGLARFALQCQEDVMPATGGSGWRDRVRGMFGKTH